ncbi:similar to wingless protein receptor Cfz2 [Betaentomopoxvirus amoorei]|uniref:AMV223 n=1 Tax=Amsacta moorei entomopoxvirus TaxID=28321 RepID=Q9EMI3_AMEPV|nr:similar to wingless protein receptor Cfz2 [Amsacta moorei entomopoxvirus]AAG02929.1 AMV223 [Amsacta moorei entomopoxvirus]
MINIKQYFLFLIVIIHIITNIFFKQLIIIYEPVYYNTNYYDVLSISKYIIVFNIIIDDIITILCFMINKKVFYEYIEYHSIFVIFPLIVIFINRSDIILYNILFAYILSILYFIITFEINYVIIQKNNILKLNTQIIK